MNYKEAFGSFSVNDLKKAKQFYAETLGLSVEEEKKEMGLSVNVSKDISFFLYPKKNHTPATFTVLNLVVDNIDKAVDELTQQGIRFEKYTGDIQTDEKGILRSKGSSPEPVGIAWFKDPAGNILSVLQK